MVVEDSTKVSHSDRVAEAIRKGAPNCCGGFNVVWRASAHSWEPCAACTGIWSSPECKPFEIATDYGTLLVEAAGGRWSLATNGMHEREGNCYITDDELLDLRDWIDARGLKRADEGA